MNDSQAMVAQSARLAKEARESVSLETYKAAIEALYPFARMARATVDNAEIVLSRGTGCEATHIFEHDFARAFEIVDAFYAQPENEPFNAAQFDADRADEDC